MKIIEIDNYNRETIADILVYENLHPWIANFICQAMRDRVREHSAYWPIVVEDNYRLSRGMEDFV